MSKNHARLRKLEHASGNEFVVAMSWFLDGGGARMSNFGPVYDAKALRIWTPGRSLVVKRLSGEDFEEFRSRAFCAASRELNPTVYVDPGIKGDAADTGALFDRETKC